MLIIISPSKTQDFSPLNIEYELSSPLFQEQSVLLNTQLRTYSQSELSRMMKLSPVLTGSTFENIHCFGDSSNLQKPALFAFTGTVFKGLKKDYSKEQLEYAQQHLKILSGLYGILRPLDQIEAYRLDLTDPLIPDGYPNLYQFWRSPVTEHIRQQLSDEQVLINMASLEYSKVIDYTQISCPVINIHFKDWKNGTFKVVGTYAKQARGWMLDHLISSQIENHNAIKNFKSQGYAINSRLSNDTDWVFTRE